MCGIVGFTGSKQAAPILLDGLSKLEYRGYDSAGIAVRNGDSQAEIIKEKGIGKVEEAINELLLITPNDLNAEKVRAICNKENCIEKTGVDRLSEKSKQTLMQYDLLRTLQNKKKEAV